MIQQFPKVYINPELKPIGFQKFISQLSVGLCKEINLILKAFYQYDDKGIDDLFTIIERTWVGILNNSLIRTDHETVTLQEFRVSNGEKIVGRCDLLFRMNMEQKNIDSIVETKCYEFKDNWKSCNFEAFYDKILTQNYNYYNAEINYYQPDIYFMVIVFEWIRSADKLEKAKNMMDEWDQNTEPTTDFLTLYMATNRGVFVYGKIISAKEYILKLANK